MLNLIAAALLLAPSPAAAQKKSGVRDASFYMCDMDSEVLRLLKTLKKLKERDPAAFAAVDKERLRYNGSYYDYDRANCSLVDWCRRRRATIIFSPDERRVQNAPDLGCRRPFWPPCKSGRLGSPYCVWEVRLGTAKGAPLARFETDKSHDGAVSFNGPKPVYEKPSGNAGDFGGLRFTVKDKVYKVQPRTWFIFARTGDGGALVDTGASLTEHLASRTCKSYDLKCPNYGTISCANLGLTKTGEKWVDARGGSWAPDPNSGRGCSPERPAVAEPVEPDHTRDIIRDKPAEPETPAPADGEVDRTRDIIR